MVTNVEGVGRQIGQLLDGRSTFGPDDSEGVKEIIRSSDLDLAGVAAALEIASKKNMSSRFFVGTIGPEILDMVLAARPVDPNQFAEIMGTGVRITSDTFPGYRPIAALAADSWVSPDPHGDPASLIVSHTHQGESYNYPTNIRRQTFDGERAETVQTLTLPSEIGQRGRVISSNGKYMMLTVPAQTSERPSPGQSDPVTKRIIDMTTMTEMGAIQNSSGFGEHAFDVDGHEVLFADVFGNFFVADAKDGTKTEVAKIQDIEGFGVRSLDVIGVDVKRGQAAFTIMPNLSAGGTQAEGYRERTTVVVDLKTGNLVARTPSHPTKSFPGVARSDELIGIYDNPQWDAEAGTMTYSPVNLDPDHVADGIDIRRWNYKEGGDAKLIAHSPTGARLEEILPDGNFLVKGGNAALYGPATWSIMSPEGETLQEIHASHVTPAGPFLNVRTRAEGPSTLFARSPG